MFGVVLFLFVHGGWTQCVLPQSPELDRKARANWNATMTAHGRNRAFESTCSNDLRSQMPACMQYAEDWCWATAVAELAHFWKPKQFPEKSNDCHGLECNVVSYKYGKDDQICCPNATEPFCPGSCCRVPFFGDAICSGSNKKCIGFQREIDQDACRSAQCGKIAGSADDILQAIQHSAGQTYDSKLDGPLTQTQLDTVLSKGHPLIISVFWTVGGGHALTLAGCGGGHYYLHDSLHKAGVYQELTYEQVVMYVPPEKPSLRGQWHETFFRKGDSVSADELGEGVVV